MAAYGISSSSEPSLVQPNIAQLQNVLQLQKALQLQNALQEQGFLNQSSGSMPVLNLFGGQSLAVQSQMPQASVDSSMGQFSSMNKRQRIE
jgi:hypothetical protein